MTRLFTKYYKPYVRGVVLWTKDPLWDKIINVHGSSFQQLSMQSADIYDLK